MPGRAILSAGVKSARALMPGRLVLSDRAQVLIPHSPTTSARGMPRALAHRVTKPGAPVPAMSSAPASMASLMTLPPSTTCHVTSAGGRPDAAIAASSRRRSRMTIKGK